MFSFDKVKIYLEMIKFQHSIFALPIAYLGAFLAEMNVPDMKTLLWITLAMVGARSFAMAANRLIVAEIDRQNPRTAERALLKGHLSISNVIIFALMSLGFFLLAVYNLAPVCRYVWPFAVIPFIIYPYTKRFTWLSHIVLGICLGLAPVGAWVAVTNTVSAEPLIIGTAVLLWVIGVYAWSAKSGFLEMRSLSADSTYYNLLVQGFHAGQPNLKRAVPPGLARLADPYDPVANTPYRWIAMEDKPLEDISYYKGKLYLYFGVTPALLLFWPYLVLTGHYLFHRDAVLIFCGILFSWGCAGRSYCPFIIPEGCSA